MSTRTLKPKGRDKLQQRIYYKNHQKILDVFCEVYARQGLRGQGIRQKYLLRKTGIKSPRILRKHLKDLLKRGLVTKEKRLWSLTPNRKIVQAWERMINKLTLNMVRSGIDSEEFFSQVAFVFVPRETEKARIYDANFITLDIWREFQDFVSTSSKKMGA